MITLSDKIKLDIQGKSVSLIPLIVVDVVKEAGGVIINTPIFISTNKGLFQEFEVGGTIPPTYHFFEDRGLKISSVKESIDLINRKFKINKLSFSLNNFPINGVRFSDFVAERDLLNKTVEVYYKTQSCTTLDDCMLVYKGNIRRFDHDSKICKVQLEDLTEDKLSKKIPIGNTGYKTSVYNKEDLNRPIPIVYGKVEKAPLIALLEEKPLSGETSIKLIPDDIDRGIAITEFFADPSTELLDIRKSPLYIYKDDYFQALEVYNYDIIDDPDEDWNWDDYEQYSIQENYLEILKKYTGTHTKNPVADNEIQCIKRRFPNDMKIIPNPVGLSQEELEADGGWEDTVGQGVIFDDPYIKSPEASYDNPYISLSKARNWYTHNLTPDHLSTFAQIPDQTQIFTSNWNYQVADFKPYAYGIQNHNATRWQYEITGWLMRYAHHFNSETINEELHVSEDPKLMFIRLPKEEYLKERCNYKLWEHFSGIVQGGMAFPNGDIIPEGFSVIDWINQGNPLYQLIGKASDTTQPECRQNSYANMNASAAMDWATQSGCADAIETYVTSGNYNATDLFQYGDNDSDESSTSFENIARDTYEDSNQRINYPNFCVQFELLYRTWETDSTKLLLILAILGQLEAVNSNGETFSLSTLDSSNLIDLWRAAFEDKHWVNISLENDSRTEYDKGGHYTQGGNFEDSFYFNFFQIEGQNYEYLYEVDDFPMYAPYHCTSKGRSGWRVQVGYSCMWNGVSYDSAPDANVDTSASMTGESKFFGWYGLKGLNGYGTKFQRENWILSGSAFNDGWFVWMKDATEGVVGSVQTPTATGELHNDELGIVRTPANTLFACRNISRKQSGGGTYGLHRSDGYSFDTGTEISADDAYITLFKGASTERRLGFVFPFNEQDISSDIKTDTYFDGKIRLDFSDETEGTADYSQKVVLGAVDVSEDDVFIWSVFDNNEDNSGAVLIDQTLSTCRNTYPTTWYDSSVYDAEAESDTGNGVINLYDGELLSVTDDFWEVNNYNSLAMLYRVESTASDISKVSQFTTNIHSISLIHYIVFEGAFDDTLYANVIGRANTMDDVINVGGSEVFKYTGVEVNSLQDTGDPPYDELIYDTQKVEIEKPSDIIYHFLEKELNLIDTVNTDSIEIARTFSNVKFGFSFSEEKKGVEFINDLCKNCNLFPLFKSTSEFSLATIRNTYSHADVSIIIKSDEIIKYNFTRTPVEKIHTMVNVKYKKDYAEDELMEQTGYVDGYDMFGNMDDANRSGSWNSTVLGGSAEIEFKGYSYDYLGIDVEDKILDFEAEFIRTYDSAKQLRNFLYMWNCNQKNIFKLTLPLKYLALEVGDIVAFDSLIDDIKAYGEDYTTSNTRNGQEIYPFFIIHSVDKKQKNINIEVTQLHNLQPNFTAYVGSITRTRGIKLGQFEPFSVTDTDTFILGEFLEGGQPYYTETQKRVSDVNENGYIDSSDSDDLHSLLINGEYLFGDISGDGVVNVVDIIALVNAIIGETATDEMIAQMDLNDDGTMNVVDIIMLVNIIIGNE